MKQAPVFDEIYKKYLADVSAVDLIQAGDRLGINVDGDQAVIPFYGILHRVSGMGVMDAEGKRPIHAVSVILCKYLLLYSKQEPPITSEWVQVPQFSGCSTFCRRFQEHCRTAHQQDLLREAG